MAEAQGNQNQGTGDQNKTFTQAEVDAIIGDRLAREKSKYVDYEDLIISIFIPAKTGRARTARLLKSFFRILLKM